MANFHGNQHVQINTRFKRFMAHLVHKTKIALSLIAIASLTGWAVLAGAHLFPQTAFADRIVEVSKQPEFPVFNRILDCESGKRDSNGKAIPGSATHYASNGQVISNINTNGTIDLGIAMINTVNFKEATKLGYDLTKEEDNRAFGLYLFMERGSEPWYSSKACWNK